MLKPRPQPLPCLDRRLVDLVKTFENLVSITGG